MIEYVSYHLGSFLCKHLWHDWTPTDYGEWCCTRSNWKCRRLGCNAKAVKLADLYR